MCPPSKGGARALFRFPILAAATVAILATILFAQSADAQTPAATVGIDHDRGTPGVNPGPAYASSGTLANVALVLADIPDDPGANFWDIRVAYDPSVISPIACETPFSNNSFCITTQIPDTVRVLAVRAISLEGTFVIADIAFKALGAPNTCTDLTIEIEDLSGQHGTPVNANTLDGQICISASIPQQQAIVGIDHAPSVPADIDAGPLELPIDFEGIFSVVVDSPQNGVSFAIVRIVYDPAVFDVTFCLGATLCSETGSPTSITLVRSGSLSPFQPRTIGNVAVSPVGNIGDCSPLEVTVQALEDLLDQPLGSTPMNGQVCITDSFFPTPTPTPGPSPGTTPRPVAVGGIAGLAPVANPQLESSGSAGQASLALITWSATVSATLVVITIRYARRRRL